MEIRVIFNGLSKFFSTCKGRGGTAPVRLPVVLTFV